MSWCIPIIISSENHQIWRPVLRCANIGSYIYGMRVVFRSDNAQVANLHLLFATCREFWFCVCRSFSYHLLFVAVLWVLSSEPYWLSSPEQSSYTSIPCIWAAVACSAAARASGVLRSAIPKAKPCTNMSVGICGPYVVTLVNQNLYLSGTRQTLYLRTVIKETCVATRLNNVDIQCSNVE